MQTHTFLAAVRDQALASLPEPLQAAQSRIRYGMLQLHYGEPRIHYEVWLVRKTARIEIGLHFEADRDLNHAQAIRLADRALEIREALGAEAEVEAWTPSWTRLHLTLPLDPLGPGLCAEVAGRLAALLRLTADQVTEVASRAAGETAFVRHERGRHWRRRRALPGAGR